MSDHTDTALSLLDGDAVGRLQTYFHSGTYSGAEWDLWPPNDEAADDRVTRLDIASLSLLSIPVGHALMTGALVGMHFPSMFVTDIRNAPPPTRDNEWGPFYSLRSEMQKVHRVGRVIASKIFARKQPALFPVWDLRVRRLLWGFDKNSAESRRFDDWVAMHQLMQDTDVTGRLEELHAEAELDPRVSLLRVLDVAIWMLDE